MKCNTKYKDIKLEKIPEEWTIYEISNIAEVVGGGTPSTKIPEYWGGDISWITPKDLANFEFRHIRKGVRKITKKGLDASSAKILPKDTVLLTTRAPVGYLAIADNEVTTNQGFRSLIPNRRTKSEFLFYLLKNNIAVLKANATGTTFGELSGSVLKSLKFAFPPVEEQETITKILSDLDSKIELNNQINKNLEQIAQAIFKNWFVDFEFPNENGEPYKSSGGEMVNSELGPIPKEWKIVKLKRNIKFAKGKKPKIIFKEKSDELSKYLTINVLSGKDYLYAHPKSVILAEKDNILMVMDGASSGKIYFGANGIVASTLAKVEILNNNLSTEYVYHFLKYNENEINNHTTGSAIPHTDKDFVLSLKIILPDANNIMFSKFNKTIGSIENKIIQNNDENKRLTKIRDTLLPKLMSGEIRVLISRKF